MIFSEATIVGIQKEFKELEGIMKGLGFVRWTWDYEKVVYDKAYNDGENTYYLRIPANVLGDVYLENPKAKLKLNPPIFAEHFFPHGLDNQVEIPKNLSDEIKQKLEEVKEALI